MNGWGKPEPAWWLNLQAQPERRRSSSRTAAARPRTRGAGRGADGLWEQWREYDGDNLDGWASLRERETAVVVLEPVARAD